MTSLIKKLKYYSQIFPLSRRVRNWPLIILAYLFPDHPYQLNLDTGDSFKISHHLDALTIKEIFLDQDYKPKTKKPRVIVDIGTNIGTFSILMSKTFPEAKIFSFEPDKRTFSLLKANLRLNRCANVFPVRKGVSNRVGHATFYSYPASGLSSLNQIRKANSDAIRTRVELTTLTNIFKDNHLKQIDILKIDAEGAEFDILLDRRQPPFPKIKEIVLEYHDSLTHHHHQEIIEKLRQYGYKTVIHSHPIEETIGIIHAY